jgi:hypothetical protein
MITGPGVSWPRLVACLGCAFLVGTRLNAAPPTSSAVWREDLRAIVNRIRVTHPDPFSRVSQRRFDDEVARLDRDIPTLNDAQRAARLMGLVALLKDGHTWIDIVGPQFQTWFPIRFYEFTDGYFITAARKEYGDLAGLQVLKIGGVEMHEAARRARALISADNEFGSKSDLHALSSAPLMEALALAAGGRLTLRVREPGGAERDAVVMAMAGDDPESPGLGWRFRLEEMGQFIGQRGDWIAGFQHLPSSAFRVVDSTRPPHLRYRSWPYAALLDADDYYMQVNFVQDSPDESFVAFFRRAMREVDAVRPKRLIVDFRYNSGGDGSKITAMIHEFIKREDTPPWRELYVLSGRKTHSAAIIALRAFVDHTQANMVGEPAGANYNMSGDAMDFPFPRIGLTLKLSTLRHDMARSNDITRVLHLSQSSPSAADSTNTIPIDVPALFSAKDYFAGRDPAVDAIRSGKEMRGLASIARTEGGGVARRVYETRRAEFGMFRWWKPAREADLNEVGYEFLRAKRVVDAVNVFQLAAELFPDSWNTWDSLGEAQRASSDLVAALASYRRSLALNPGNTGARDAIADLTK